MLRAAFMFFVLALVSILFGTYNIAGLSLEAGKVLLGLFVILSITSFIVGLASNKKSSLVP